MERRNRLTIFWITPKTPTTYFFPRILPNNPRFFFVLLLESDAFCCCIVSAPPEEEVVGSNWGKDPGALLLIFQRRLGELFWWFVVDWSIAKGDDNDVAMVSWNITSKLASSTVYPLTPVAANGFDGDGDEEGATEILQ
jgi:hypothetical protein